MIGKSYLKELQSQYERRSYKWKFPKEFVIAKIEDKYNKLNMKGFK